MKSIKMNRMNCKQARIDLKKCSQLFIFILTTGKRTQEIICVYSCISLMVINLYLIVVHFRMERLSAVIFSAICGILTADFGSGIVHWAADTWGSIELPVIGKVNIFPETKFPEHSEPFFRTFFDHSENTTLTRLQLPATTGLRRTEITSWLPCRYSAN